MRENISKTIKYFFLFVSVVQHVILVVCNNQVQLFTYAVCIKMNGLKVKINIYATHFILYDYLLCKI